MAEDEPLAVPCAAHPDVETGLRCGTCLTPICPRCLIMTPVGARCRSCARLRAHPVYDVRPVHYLRAASAGLGVALLGGVVVPAIPVFGLLALLLLGVLTGEAVTAAANRKRGAGLAVVAAATTLLGVLGAPALLALGTLPASLPLATRLATALALSLDALLSLWGLFVLLAAVLAASRVR